MVLLVEQERLILNEANLLSDSAEYSTSSTSWYTLHDYGNITLAQAGLVGVKFSCRNDGASGDIRIKIGSTYVYRNHFNSASNFDVGCLVYLPAGTYDVFVEGKNGQGGSYKTYISAFQVGLLSFNDLQAFALATYSSSIQLTVASRTLPVGALANAIFMVQCTALTSSAVSNFENVGDNWTNGVSVTVDGTQVNWNERLQDGSSGVDYAFARLALPFSVGSAHTIALSKRNASTVVSITVVACPWILPYANAQIFANDFSSGSTLYAITNALFVNPTKYVCVGNVRGVSYGSATDYYASTSGTGLLQFSQVFDVIDVGLPVFFSGFGGCIEVIGADVR
jgi:hypothetical protein